VDEMWAQMYESIQLSKNNNRLFLKMI
jgi:hypothetical protein